MVLGVLSSWRLYPWDVFSGDMATGSPVHEPGCILNCSLLMVIIVLTASTVVCKPSHTGNHNKASKETKGAIVPLVWLELEIPMMLEPILAWPLKFAVYCSTHFISWSTLLLPTVALSSSTERWTSSGLCWRYILVCDSNWWHCLIFNAQKNETRVASKSTSHHLQMFHHIYLINCLKPSVSDTGRWRPGVVGWSVLYSVGNETVVKYRVWNSLMGCVSMLGHSKGLLPFVEIAVGSVRNVGQSSTI